MLQATGFTKLLLYIDNIKTVTDSRGNQKGPRKRDLADSLSCSGLRARLRLERRLLRFRAGSRL